MPEKKKCALYVRVSTLMQDVDKEAGSLSSQESLLRRYVEQKNALGPETWEVVEVYRESASAKDTRRKEFQRLLRAVNDGRISAVLFCKLDRISRSVGDLLRLVEFFREHHCEFISLHENLDTSGPMGRFMLVLFGALAEFERATTAERVREKMAWRAQVAGLWNGGVPRLGYDHDPGNKGVLTPNTQERLIVETAFKTYLRTGSIRETTRLLNEAGYRTKKYHSRRGLSQGGRRFDKSGVHRLLTDHVYVGKQQHNGQWLAAQHQPLIDEALFRDVQALLARNHVVRPGTRRTTKHVFLLEGILQCKCGASMTPTWSRGRHGGEYRYYDCRRKRDDGTCNAPRVRADDIENIITQRLIRLSEDPALLAHVLEQANQGNEDQRETLRDKTNALLAKYTSTNTQIASLVDFLATGSTSTSVKERLTELEGQKAELQQALDNAREELRELKDRTANIDKTKEGLAQFANAFAQASMEQRKQLFQLLVDHAVLGDDKVTLAVFEIDLNEKPPALEGARGCPNWWTEGDSNP